MISSDTRAVRSSLMYQPKGTELSKEKLTVSGMEGEEFSGSNFQENAIHYGIRTN